MVYKYKKGHKASAFEQRIVFLFGFGWVLFKFNNKSSNTSIETDKRKITDLNMRSREKETLFS